MSKNYTVAVVGATGAVGEKMMEQLEKRKFPIKHIKFLASKRSTGKSIEFKGQSFTVEEATPEAFDGVDIALFSAGGSVSKILAPEAAKRGAVVIDNTSAFRMVEDIPLVVPEVNPQDLKSHSGIIANPNCSTIQMVCALHPIKEAFGLTRVIVSTYQAVSGAGADAINELKDQSGTFGETKNARAQVLPVKSADAHYPIAFNVIPQIDIFDDNGYTLEEMKMINETKKILHMPNLSVAATCVRLPVVSGHSESVFIEVEKDGVSVSEMRAVLESAKGILVQDNPAKQQYPMPLFAEGEDEVFVGRIRKDLSNDRGFHLWIVSDNLLKGAALNSIQIAEAMIKEGII
ncbi:MAG TPA: aspartate-semialdehyde dehydrogenase [Paenisporosarcina sp.]|nr:aspartate-semialdehyde dehydrogenase [Paenisporosarcina sp.]